MDILNHKCIFSKLVEVPAGMITNGILSNTLFFKHVCFCMVIRYAFILQILATVALFMFVSKKAREELQRVMADQLTSDFIV